MLKTIEDCLCELSLQKIDLKASDKKLIGSLANQIDLGTGLTDRQLRLARKKLDEYRDYLESLGTDVDFVKNNLSLDMRYLDRSRWIRFVFVDDTVRIAVRFLYAKKLIKTVDRLKNEVSHSSYKRDEKTWYFEYSERNLYKIVKAFERFDFEVDDAVLNIYNQICNLDSSDVKPGVYNRKLKNLPERAQKILDQEIGPVSRDNLALYKDRSILYGLHHFDEADLRHSLAQFSHLAQQIATRSVPSVIIEKAKHSEENVFLCLEELQRLPLLVIIPSQTPELLIKTHEKLKNLVDPREISVMFRLDNDAHGEPINQWIKETGVNSPLDKNKKIVYTLDASIPKPLLKSEWTPRAILSLVENRMLVSSRKIFSYYGDQDLIIHLDSSNGEIIRHRFFEMERIE